MSQLGLAQTTEEAAADTRSVSVRFPADVVTGMRQLARQHNRSLSSEIIWAARQYMQTCSPADVKAAPIE